MNITEKKGKKDSFVMCLNDYYGSGWVSYIEMAVKSKINPKKYGKNEKEISVLESEYEINFEDNGLSVKIEIDDLGPVSLILKENITEKSKQKLRDWATIIATEVEKLKNS